MKFFLSCGLLLLASSTALAASVPSDDTAEKHVRDLTTWFRGNGGYFNFKLEIRRADPKDPTSEFGIFARKDIKPKERLIEIPADLIIEPMFDFEVEDNQEVKYFEQREHFETLCDLTLTLIAEMELGDDSDFAAYLNYLNQKDLSMLPVMWSEQGKELMRLLANKAYAADISHPPYGAVDWMDAFVKTGCIDEDDDFEKRIATLVYSRAMGPLNDTVLVPVLDMINHSNKEEERNVECTTVITDDFVHVKASTEIKAGEQLFLSYNKCVLDCQGKDLGTDYLFRAHGFLEPFPQQWDLGDVTVVVDEVEGDNGKTVLEARHVGGLPNEIVLMYLTESIEALQETLHGDAMTNAPGRVPEKELETIHLYHNALLKTLSSAVKQTDVMAIEHKFTCIAEDSCPDEGSSWFRYDDLDKSSQFGLDTYYSMTYQCDTLAFDDRQEVMEDQIESHYQIIEYFSNPKTKEMCFFLDGTWQICTSYRPQYHEMGVHETIRYLPHEPKRILWVGGGDSMFLHEILKYPSLELAVGLELDQKVVRGAFQYFGVQPHWDNEKVQWWFGDASKSLLMLPEDYYRSFDVVLVDLSDTLLSLSVTKEMDIIGALSLLLKPDGVFAMNELAFDKITDVFEHTLQFQHHLIPKICTQNFVVASHGIDLLRRNLTDHNIETLYVDPLDVADDRLELVHDYRRNSDNKYKKMCKAHADEKEELITQQGSPGIFMVVEAEEVTMDLNSINHVQNAVSKTLEKAGFKVKSFAVRKESSLLSESNNAETILVMREGYVAIRTWPEHNYCAFDIHLWSSFEKHDAAKKAVVTGVEGKMTTTSSYRIVAGGMFGVSTWKDDVKVHGPQIHQVCDQSSLPVRDAPMDIGTFELAIEAGLSLVLDEEKYVAAALCGDQGACRSIGLLEKNEKVGEVMPLYLCSDLTGDDQHSEDGRMRIIECERGILKSIQESLSDDKRLRVIIVDRSAPRLLVQMLLRIFIEGKDNKNVLAPDIMVLTTIENESEGWKRNFLDKIRKDVVKVDPLFRAEVLFNTTASSMELGILSSGDESFMKDLIDMAENVEKKSNLALEIREIFGGLWRLNHRLKMPDEEAEEFFTHEDYDRTSPLEQWWSQQPVGHQTLFQFEARPLLVGDHVHAYFRGVTASRCPVGLITAVHNEDSYDITFIAFAAEAFHYHKSLTRVGHEIHGTSVPRNELRKVGGSPNNPKDEQLSEEKVMSALQYALSAIDPRAFSAPEIHKLEVDGDGCLLVAYCSGGSVVLMWDGRIHIDVNLFTFSESSSAHDAFEQQLKTMLRSLEAILVDEQPRGFGRVVTFKEDLGIGEREAPYWA